MAHGDWYWHELATPDRDSAGEFYGKVFGWTFRDMDMGENGIYKLIQKDGEDSGGMLQMEGDDWKGIPPHWMIYIEVDDCDAAAKTAKAAGGDVRVEPFDIPGVGRMAVIADPQGAVFSIMTGASG